MTTYPFHNYKGAIDDAHYFVGRNKLLRQIDQQPFSVRILLGGRRIGKTSTLHAIQSELLQSNSRAFPVILKLTSEMPTSLENFLYILIQKISLAIQKQKEIPAAFTNKIKKLFQQIKGGTVNVGFLSLDIDNPGRETSLNDTI